MDSIAAEPISDQARLEDVRRLYDDGLFLQAWQAGRDWGPLGEWPGLEARILGSRLGYHLGAARLSDWLCRCAYRDHPDNADAMYFFAYVKLRRRGPYEAWRWWKQNPELPGNASDEIRASWQGLWAEVAGTFRDYDTADRLIREATRIDANSPWVMVCQSAVLQMQDRYDESLAKAREAMEVRPWYRPAVQQIGHLLTLRENLDEAQCFLTEASQRLESASVCAELLLLEIESKQYEAAEKTLARIETLFPLVDRRGRQWFAGQQAELAYFRGDYDKMIEAASASNSEFQKSTAERLKNPEHRRASAVTLPVGFVRQHHHTCAPATLSAISRFWNAPADHLEVVDEICYDGTSGYSERKWAVEHGWYAREFSITEETTHQLIDRSIPFTFTTVEPSGGHLQAIIGYDGRRGTIIIRDPYHRSSGEAIAEKILERFQLFGPRGMLLVPLEYRTRVDDINLPDAELWDALFELDTALESHRRLAAEAVIERLNQVAPDHRLTLEARRRLAMYDYNSTAQLAIVRQMLDQFPECDNLVLQELSLLQSHGSREDRLAKYREQCEKKDSHPIFWQRYANELLDDARQWPEANNLLRRTIRRWPTEPSHYHALGHLYWSQRRFPEALELYHLAACLNDKDERYALTLFSAARSFKQTEEVLEFLRRRYERFGRKSSHPARSLANALFELSRDAEALAVLDEAIELRPDDGSLLLVAADSHGQATALGAARSHELLARASEKSPRTEWLDSAGRLADLEGRLHDALGHWRELAKLQPMNVGAHRAVARLLASTDSQIVALQYIQSQVDRFPHCVPMFELLAEWTRDEPQPVREPILQRGASLFPENAWLRRELSYLLLESRQIDEAQLHANAAHALEPMHASWYFLEASLLRARGRDEEANELLRQSIQLSVDNDYAISRLMESCESRSQRLDVLAFIRAELTRQVTFGSGLLAFRQHATGVLEGDELLDVLQGALLERPDLWHAWSACVQQLLTLVRTDDALELCQRATGRFPLIPRLWLDLADVCHARLDEPGMEAALQRALEISPSLTGAARSLADLYERRHELSRAVQLLQHTAGRSPLDVVLQQTLAETLWRADRRDEALRATQRVLRSEPGYDRAWNILHRWGAQVDQPNLAIKMARELTEQRAGEARSYTMLARLLDQDDQTVERLAILDKALELNPLCVDAFDQQARTFAGQGRWDEALSACDPPVFNGHPPSELSARAASIQYERGTHEDAIARMETVVADEPGYYHAWSKLSDWYQAKGDLDGALRAAEAMVKISPHYEVSLGYLGEARLAKGDVAGAKEVLARAFELEPRYEFAGNMVFDLQFEAQEYDVAAQTIARLREHSESSYVYGRVAMLAGKQNEIATVLDALQHLAGDSEATLWAMSQAIDAVHETKCVSQAEPILAMALTKTPVCSETGSHWVRLRISQDDWPKVDELEKLVEIGTVGEHGLYAFVDECLKQKDELRLLDLMDHGSEWMKRNLYAWGCMGRGLAALPRYDLCAKWTSDWREREPAAWMLVNAVEGFRATNRFDEATECSLRTIELSRQHGREIHFLFLAIDAALANDFTRAKELFARYSEERIEQEGPDYGFIRQLMLALLESHESTPQERPKVFNKWRRELQTLRKEYKTFAIEPERQRLLRETLRQLAAVRGGIMGKFWAWWF